MALREIRQGGLGAEPHAANFWITYDDLTFRISAMRCTNNHDSLSCRITFRNEVSGQEFTETVPPGQSANHTFRQNQDYYLTDDAWGYSMRMVA